MIPLEHSFAQLQNQPLQQVKLEAVVTGAVMVKIAPERGVNITLGPHDADSDVDLEWRVIAFKQGDIGEYNEMRLQSAKEMGDTIYVEGAYTPDRKGKYLGRIEAERIEFH